MQSLLHQDVQGERQGFDELPYDASASESEKKELVSFKHSDPKKSNLRQM